MNNDVNPVSNTDDEKQNTIAEQVTEHVTEQITELSEDMEMVSPGAMLREARQALSLSQEHIASKLNFKVALVNNIEENIFDPSMPVTFNRGYLTNYAKLVGVEVEDVLASYDALDAATIQRSEMLSFSKQTAKQAEHSRVMWLSYFIVAVLIGLTVLWWQQESSHQPANTAQVAESNIADTSPQNADIKNENDALQSADTLVNSDALVNSQGEQEISTVPTVTANALENEKSEPLVPEISTAEFTFNGDCWVNIYDATGERIAWGVKKSGYVMTIQGKAPLRVTVGKPELTDIIFNGQPVDMSAFDVGNIAKFTLPVIVE